MAPVWPEGPIEAADRRRELMAKVDNIMPQQAWPIMPADNSDKAREVLPDDCAGQAFRPISSKDRKRTTTFDMAIFTRIMKAEDDGYWVETTQADFFFGGWIVINALVLAVETDARTMENESHKSWVVLDSIFNVIFISELILRVRAQRRRWCKDVWNLFDAGLVLIGILDSWILPASGLNSDMRFITLMRVFRLMRLVRILRVLRLLRFMKELMLLVQGITSAMRAMVWGLLLLGITIFICALLMTRLVGKACCDEDDTFQNELLPELFGTFPRTAFTLFQFTMEFQPDICRETWDSGPWLTLFFLAYTMFTNVTLLNTVASVIVENILTISQAHTDEMEARKEEQEEATRKHAVKCLFDLADRDGDEMICREEIQDDSSGALEEMLNMSGVSMEQAVNMFNVMDVDSNGKVSREEFQLAVFRGHKPLEGIDVLKIQCQVDALKNKMKGRLETALFNQSQILEALQQMETRQEARLQRMEDQLASLQQPAARELDTMSIRFVPKKQWPDSELEIVAVAPDMAAGSMRRPTEPPPQLQLQDSDFREETLLV